MATKTRTHSKHHHSNSINLYEKFFLLMSLCALIIFIANLTVIQHRSRNDDTYSDSSSLPAASEYYRDAPSSNSRSSLKMKRRQVSKEKSKNFFKRTDVLGQILSAEKHLIDVGIPHRALEKSSKGSSVEDDEESYKHVTGVFCKLNWAKHKSDPASVPMFKDLVAASPDCRNPIRMSLSTIMNRVRQIDSSPSPPTHSIPPTGFTFHESRCGSTLVANSLAAVDPPAHRVYSESSPLIAAMKACSDKRSGDRWGEHCEKRRHLALLRDVVYLMGRSDDALEKKLFFKIQSIGTKSIGVLREAFPEVPWVFVYRDPVQIMMSHLKTPDQKSAVCLRYRSRVQDDLRRFVEEKGMVPEKLTSTQFCAAHLASLCNAALSEYDASTTGLMLNYVDIPDKLLDTILPDHFKISIGEKERERVMNVCTKYSKGRGKKGDWKEDSEAKDERAWPEAKEAADVFLKESFERLLDGGEVNRKIK